MKRDLDFIVAMTKERVIGIENRLPWKLPQDLKRFREITTGSGGGNTIIMGRKTFDSIGRPLPNRKNVILTRDTSVKPLGVVVCHDWSEVSSAISGQAFVIGGGEIFTQALPRLRRLYLTLILENIHGDSFFPELNFDGDFLLEEESEIFTEPLKFQFQNWRHRDAEPSRAPGPK